MSYTKLADVYLNSADKPQAREVLRLGRAIIAGLLKEHPGLAQLKNDLSWFDGRVADMDKITWTVEPKSKPIKKKRRR